MVHIYIFRKTDIYIDIYYISDRDILRYTEIYRDILRYMTCQTRLMYIFYNTWQDAMRGRTGGTAAE